MDDPYGYGRVVRDASGRVTRIVEQKDADPEEQEIREINSGIYCVESDFLFGNIKSIGNDNAQKEFYLTDLVAIAVRKGLACLAMPADADEIMGVNDRSQLADAARILRRRINHELMLSGVTLIDPEQTYIDFGVIIGADTIIHPNCHIGSGTVIGSGCEIEQGVSISGCRIGTDCHIKAGSVLEDSELHENVAVGPMAHLRPGTVLHNHVKIGNFVETKKIVMGEGSKASHLTYLGDAEIGRDVNIGCGTITCNYDGVKKHRTVIGDQVFIGSDVQLVAPVTVGRNSLVAAGTTVTVDVPPDSLALSRVPQVNKEGWRLKKR
jgi:bifunctional UDP-N-acetylglucosamine pyrophosphorylase/glucosamine-1-phosphate N-acetyltransferase